jgi:hypothetical protein
MTLPKPGQASAEIPITGRGQIDACAANANAGLVISLIGKCGRATLSHICCLKAVCVGFRLLTIHFRNL